MISIRILCLVHALTEIFSAVQFLVKGITMPIDVHNILSQLAKAVRSVHCMRTKIASSLFF